MTWVLSAGSNKALDSGQVDAWAGLDPFMAEAEIESRDRLFSRDHALISPGTLLVREDVAAHALQDDCQTVLYRS